MDIPSTTDAASASTSAAIAVPVSSASDSAHRSCLGCRRRMSQLKHDPHSSCSNCRKVKCDVLVRCIDWPQSAMEAYLKHRRVLESKSKRKDSTTSPAVISTSSQPTLVSEHSPVVGNQNIEIMFKNGLIDVGNLAQLVRMQFLMFSLAAPLSVPDRAPD